jgi:hypothetical protein
VLRVLILEAGKITMRKQWGLEELFDEKLLTPMSIG